MTIDVVQVSDLHVTEAGEVLGQDARVNLELTCPSGWLDLDFDAGTIVPPGYRHFPFHADGTIESTAHFVDDPRYAERLPYPDWVPKVLAGLERSGD